MSDALDTQLTQLQAQLNDVAKSMRLAQQTGQAAALEQFRQQYRTLSAQLGALRAQANQAGAPSAFLLRLDSFADTVIQTGASLGVAVEDAVGSLGFLARYGIFLLVGVVAVLVWYYGKEYKVLLGGRKQ